MVVLLCADLFETLQIDWKNILLYFAAFAILFVGLTFLLFKPVRKFMENRQKQVKDEIDEASRIRAEAEQSVREQEIRVRDAEESVRRKTAEIEQEKLLADSAREELLAKARAEADEIRLAAKRDAAAEREKAVLAAKDDVTDIAVSLAKTILEREIAPVDDEKLVDECIREWKGDD